LAAGQGFASSFEITRALTQLLLKVERRVAAKLRVILVRDRSPEQRHDPVAPIFVNRALEAVNAFGQDLEETTWPCCLNAKQF
jgi:hypothetical protein